MAEIKKKERKSCQKIKNEVTAELTEVLSGIGWPTVIKPLPSEYPDILAIATLPGEIWLLNTHKMTPKDDPSSNAYKFLNLRDDIGQLGIKYSGIKATDSSQELSTTRKPFYSWEVGLYDERGLLGMEFDPEFQENGRFYLYYSLLDEGTTSPPVVPVNPLKPATLRQSWDDFSLYSHVNTLEEWNCCVCESCREALVFNERHRPVKSRILLQIKQPFHNHNGFNNLVWDSDLRSLLLITGDGGYLNDPFNLAQNLDFPHGKILSVIPNAITGYSCPIAQLSELPKSVKTGISVISNGLRQSHGLHITQRNVNSPNFTLAETADGTVDRTDKNQTSEIEYFLTHNGEVSGEGLYRYNPRANSQQTPLKQVINIGWSGWDNGQPNIADPSNNTETSFSGIRNEMITPKTVLVSWNDNTNFSKELEINDGDTLRFLSSDGKAHNLYLVEPFDSDMTILGWRLLEQIQGTTVGLDVLYRPSIGDRINDRDNGFVWFLSTEERGFRLGVRIKAVESSTTNLARNVALMQNVRFPIKDDASKLDVQLPIVLYPKRILKNKLLPYFRYPHRLLETAEIRNVLVGIEYSSPWFIESLIAVNEFGDSLVNDINMSSISGVTLGLEEKKILYEKNQDRNQEDSENSQLYSPEIYGMAGEGGRFLPSRESFAKFNSKSEKKCKTRCKGKSNRPYDGRKCKGEKSDSSSSVEETTIGNRITGVAGYRGDSVLQQGLIVSEWNHKLNNLLSSNLGALYWVNLDPEGRRRFRSIIPKIIRKDPLFFVSLGSNRRNSRVFVGTFSSPFSGECSSGGVMEIKINVE